jgi:hypothetical protein
MDGRLTLADDSALRLLMFEVDRFCSVGRLVTLGDTVLGLELTLLDEVRGRGV